MRDFVVIAIGLAFTCLLIWFRSLLFKRRAGDLHRVYILSRGHDNNGREESNSADARILSEDERIELAVMQDRMLRLLR